MKKVILFLLISGFAFALNKQALAKNLLGSRYYKHRGLVSQILKNRNSVESIVMGLEANGLIPIKFSSARTIHTTFIFTDNNPQLDNIVLSEVLRKNGFTKLLPIYIESKNRYKITYEMKSYNYISPSDFITGLREFNCRLAYISRYPHYTYTINCSRAVMPFKPLSSQPEDVRNYFGTYWFKRAGFRKIAISNPPSNTWHPYVVFYDRHMNILRVITSSKVRRNAIYRFPRGSVYVKVQDNYAERNIHRGLSIKGLK